MVRWIGFDGAAEGSLLGVGVGLAELVGPGVGVSRAGRVWPEAKQTSRITAVI